jgi:hypothetical protein
MGAGVTNCPTRAPERPSRRSGSQPLTLVTWVHRRHCSHLTICLIPQTPHERSTRTKKKVRLVYDCDCCAEAISQKAVERCHARQGDIRLSSRRNHRVSLVCGWFETHANSARGSFLAVSVRRQRRPPCPRYQSKDGRSQDELFCPVVWLGRRACVCEFAPALSTTVRGSCADGARGQRPV